MCVQIPQTVCNIALQEHHLFVATGAWGCVCVWLARAALLLSAQNPYHRSMGNGAQDKPGFYYSLASKGKKAKYLLNNGDNTLNKAGHTEPGRATQQGQR